MRVTHLRPTKADLDRLAKAAASGGVVMREEFISADGSRIIVTAGAPSEANGDTMMNDLDKWIAAHADKTQGH